MIKTIRYIIVIVILILSFQVILAQKEYYSPDYENWSENIKEDSVNLLYKVYLIGDLKYPDSTNQNLKLLETFLNEEGENSAVVILGDILYPFGLRDSVEMNYSEDTLKLNYIIQLFNNYRGDIVFLPGNHDWAKGKANGQNNLNNLELYIEDKLGRGNVFLPDEGGSGPVEIKLTDDIVLIVFDSQWFFQKHDKPVEGGEGEFESETEIFVQIEDAIRRNRDRKVIVASHHPLKSVGYHGGYFPASDLLFPLLNINKYLYIPLPGFIYTGYRKYIGNIQDLAHPDYKTFRTSLLEVLKDYPNVIYAAGHEHNLQYFKIDSLHHIISGGGGKGTYISGRKKKTDFAIKSSGFATLSFYKNGNVWVEFVGPDNTPNGRISFTTKLFNKPVYDAKVKEEFLSKIDFGDSTVTAKLSEVYNRGSFMRFLMGENYRNIWNTEVDLEVFDIGSERGGLSIIKRGGGQQTRSIRMEDSLGRQYVLRSVNKYVEKALAENMRNTIALDVLQDGISASHPFSSLTVPKLADAAGVMHTNPKIVWVPEDPRLGVYREELANGVFLYEERPAGNRKDVKSFGNSKKIVNTAKVIKNVQKYQKYQIDQKAVVRARLFDILINDWDRHEDQWRWASFKEKKKTIYRPIPRDRDQVYFVNEGMAMWLATKIYPLRKFQGFDHEIKDLNGLTFNGRFFDRSFMTEPGMEVWVNIAEDIQLNLSDEVIHEAISELPSNIYDSTGVEIEAKLRSRRDDLVRYSKKYYLKLAEAVNVVGTDDRELFDVERFKDGNTDVTVYSLSNKKGKLQEQLYSRSFKHDETIEIRLYGLGGKDKFTISGFGNKGIKIRVIGGKGKDSIIDESRVRGIGKMTVVYDRNDKTNTIIKSSETRLRLSKKKSVNEYDRKQFRHNRYLPYVLLGFNADDGISIGGGMNIHRHNFRDSTYHKFSGNYAFKTGAFAIGYDGLYTSIFKTLDVNLDLQLSLPRNVDNFYGIGNQTKSTKNPDFYHVRYEYVWANPALKHTLSDNFYYSFGPYYQYFKVTDTIGRYIGQAYPLELDSSAYASHHYTGVVAKAVIDTRNKTLMPERGVYWESDLTGYYSINVKGKNFLKVQSDLRLFLSFRRDPRVVFAFRFGGAANIGDYEFYHANFLGDRSNLRGFRSNRFAGDISFYQSTEIRVKILDIKSYVLNGQTGFYVFNDLGRVWVKGENSKSWHDGYGIGMWLAPFDFTAFTFAYSRSCEDSMLTFSLRFMF